MKWIIFCILAFGWMNFYFFLITKKKKKNRSHWHSTNIDLWILLIHEIFAWSLCAINENENVKNDFKAYLRQYEFLFILPMANFFRLCLPYEWMVNAFGMQKKKYYCYCCCCHVFYSSKHDFWFGVQCFWSHRDP